VGEVTDPQSLAEDWRERVRAVGKRPFEDAEMLRLGVHTPEDVAQARSGEVTRAEYEEALARLEAADRELKQIKAELAELLDVDKAIAEIRARRIERVKAASAVRRAEKAIARAERADRVREQRRVAPTFLGRGVSQGMEFGPADGDALASRGLLHLESFADLAAALDLSPEKLQWLTYERTASSIDHYTRFEIPKRTGGVRLISSPKPALRVAQEWVRARILSQLTPHPAAMAFRPGVSIVDNAQRHVRAGIVVRIDLKDFFPSITLPRVRGFFRSLGYNPGTATVLALLCTDAPRVRLTHGTRTEVVAVGQRYTRYADDLTFSRPVGSPDVSPAALIKIVTKIVNAEGFRVKGSKTRLHRTGGRQTVTGWVVNGEGAPRVPRKLRRQIKAAIHNLENGKPLPEGESLARLQGYAAYIAMTNPAVGRAMLDRIAAIPVPMTEGRKG